MKHNGKSVVWRLLRRNISVGQLAGYALANLAGLAIVLTAVQFYRDVTSVWEGEDSFISRDYMIISPKVSGIGSLLGGSASAGFGAEDISALESQPWVRRVGSFTPARFDVSASVDIGHRGLSTALFLESIPDEFFDVRPRGWGYRPGQNEPVPVIISKDYLTLYNFGFASSRGLPKISEGMVSMVPLKLSVSGNGRQEYFDARIAGFSSRLNTIAVPQEFMDWANSQFGDTDDTGQLSNRLIVEVSKPGDPAIGSYLESHGYEAAGDRADSGRAAYFLSVVTAVVIGVGVIISALAFFILLLSIWLLLQKNRDKIHDLMMLGYTPAGVARYYYAIVGWINLGVLFGAVAVMMCGAMAWRGPLSRIGIESGSPWMSIAIGTAVTLLITVANFMAIRRKVVKAFR